MADAATGTGGAVVVEPAAAEFDCRNDSQGRHSSAIPTTRRSAAAAARTGISHLRELPTLSFGGVPVKGPYCTGAGRWGGGGMLGCTGMLGGGGAGHLGASACVVGAHDDTNWRVDCSVNARAKSPQLGNRLSRVFGKRNGKRAVEGSELRVRSRNWWRVGAEMMADDHRRVGIREHLRSGE